MAIPLPYREHRAVIIMGHRGTPVHHIAVLVDFLAPVLFGVSIGTTSYPCRSSVWWSSQSHDYWTRELSAWIDKRHNYELHFTITSDILQQTSSLLINFKLNSCLLKSLILLLPIMTSIIVTIAPAADYARYFDASFDSTLFSQSIYIRFKSCFLSVLDLRRNPSTNGHSTDQTVAASLIHSKVELWLTYLILPNAISSHTQIRVKHNVYALARSPIDWRHSKLITCVVRRMGTIACLESLACNATLKLMLPKQPYYECGINHHTSFHHGHFCVFPWFCFAIMNVEILACFDFRSIRNVVLLERPLLTESPICFSN